MLRDLIAEAEQAVVRIICRDIGAEGSGFLVTANGHVLTNHHVVAELTLQRGRIGVVYSNSIQVAIDGTEYPATLLNDPMDDRPVVYDYAILKIDGAPSARFLDVGETARARRGDEVVCLGYPLDFETLIATSGIVSDILRGPSHVNSLHQMTTIVSDALITFGSSGGPMLHVGTGKVIGINTRPHELSDVLRQRLETWRTHPTASDFALLRDLVDYTLKYTYVGLNHAVSIEHAMADNIMSGIVGSP